MDLCLGVFIIYKSIQILVLSICLIITGCQQDNNENKYITNVAGYIVVTEKYVVDDKEFRIKAYDPHNNSNEPLDLQIDDKTSWGNIRIQQEYFSIYNIDKDTNRGILDSFTHPDDL